MAFNLSIDRYGNENVGGGSYTSTVYVNGTNPNSATIFDLNNPPTTNNNALKSNDSYIYVGTDGSFWVWNTSTNSYTSYTQSSPYLVHAHSPAALAIPTSLGTALTNFGTTQSNNAGTAWNAATGTFTVPRAGYYQVTGSVEFQSTLWSAGTIFATGVTKNGANIAAIRFTVQANHTAGFNCGVATGISYFAVGDTIRLVAFQATGGTRTTSATLYTNLTIHEIK